jgi:hypothetical protein
MAQTNKPELVLCVAGQEDSSRTWVPDPQGRDSFRIVVRCRRGQGASPKPRSWFSYFSAIVQWIVCLGHRRKGAHGARSARSQVEVQTLPLVLLRATYMPDPPSEESA